MIFPLKDRPPHALGGIGSLVDPLVEAILVLRATAQKVGGGLALVVLIAIGGCDKSPHKSPAAAKAEAKRQQAACASPAAYARLKNAIFDQAIAKRSLDRTNLDVLADYSIVRMENPVVTAWDAALDVTHCKGRFILEVPPGAQGGLGGERQLQADIAYTAQPSADGGGLVYQQTGAEPIIAKLAAFHVSAVAYRPPPAIDEGQVASDSVQQASVRNEPVPQAVPSTPPAPPVRNPPERSRHPAAPNNPAPTRLAQGASPASTPRLANKSSPGSVPRPPKTRSNGSGEATVRAFYGALGSGNGAAASSQVVPEKRSGGAYSAGAMSRFYGHLPEPIRLTSVAPVSDGRYRVTYRYSAGRSHCNGTAVIRLTNRSGRVLISSIRSLSGC
ncbi:hypothetical protein ACUXST_001658 [Sphingomonas sp. F9_3S_D5_B_2]